MLDVAIVGAGPAGLSAAAALLQCRSKPLRVEVFDHIPRLEACGAGLAMRSNGFAALDAIDSKLCQSIAKLTCSLHTGVMRSLDGKVLNSSKMSSGKTKYGVSEQAPMGWSELRDGLADHLPAGTVHLNKRFSELQQHDDHVHLHFTDGTSVEAKIVVGADGCFSKIRQQTLGDGLPDFTGTVIWRARLSSSDLPKGESHFFLRGSMIATFYPISSDQYVWTVGAPVSCLEEVGLSAKTGPTGPKADVKGKLDPPEGNRGEAQGHGQVAKGTAAKTGSADSQQETKDKLVATQAEQAQNGSYRQPVAKAAELSASERCRRVWGNNAQVIKDIIDATDESTVLEHNMHVRHPDSLSQGFWGTGRVTLVGDAAHPMRPASGQGVNQALEDAVELAQAIQEGGLMQDSLRAYEASRIPRVQQILAAEMASGLEAYANRPAELPADLAAFEHAKAKWEGTDNGAYERWIMQKEFSPLKAQIAQMVGGHT
ncbi:hypothetical protein WJX82_006692 [Trebouxia sp. C0006]